MAIDLFEELWDARSGSIDKTYQNAFSRSWIVHTSTIEQTNVSVYDAIYNHGNCPKIGDLYPGDDDAYCQNVSINPEQNDPQTWKVVADYSTNPDATSSGGGGGGSGGGGGGNGSAPPAISTQQQGQKPADKSPVPTLRPPDIRVTFVAYPEVLTKLRNSADDPFMPPITVERYRPVFTIGCNASSVNAYTIATYIGKVNSSSVTFNTGTGMALSIPEKTGKIKNIGVELLLEGSIQYWRLNYEIEINTTVTNGVTTGWDMVIRDQGFNILKENNEKVQMTSGGRTITVPADLDLNGQKNPAGEPPQYITFPSADVWGTINFATLPGLGFF